MEVLNKEEVKLRKDEFWAVRGVSLKVRRGETVGLIGHNGAGKTTLFRMINGLIKPDAGHIEVRGRMQALIALGAGFNPVLTGRENIYVNAAVLGIPKVEVDRQFDEIVDFSGIEEFIDTPVKSYSSGMTVRLGFAVAAHMNPDILLIDEVLAVGDVRFKEKCYGVIEGFKKKGVTILLVSHSPYEIRRLCDRAIWIDNHRIKDDGPVGRVLGGYMKAIQSSRIADSALRCGSFSLKTTVDSSVAVIDSNDNDLRTWVKVVGSVKPLPRPIRR